MRAKTLVNLVMLGHEGHGKTTLTAAIVAESVKLGRATAKGYDEINAGEEENIRGLVVNTALVNFETEKRAYGLIDFPGSENCGKHLVAGPAQPDAAVLAVGAPDGVMPQTGEHIRLARQTGIPYIVVYLNKCDLADEEKLAVVEEEIRGLLSKNGYPGDTTPIVRGSALLALNGEAGGYGIQSVRALLNVLDDHVPDPLRDADSPFFMFVEGVASITGRGTVVSGKIETGKVKIGDEVEIVGLRDKRKAVVTGTEMFHKSVPEAVAGFNAGILLRGVAKEDVERGMVIAKPGSVKAHAKFKAVVYLRKKEEGGRSTPFAKGDKLQFSLGTTDVTGTVHGLFRGDNDAGPIETAAPGDTANVEIELIAPIVLSPRRKFEIREGGKTRGNGVVTEILL